MYRSAIQKAHTIRKALSTRRGVWASSRVLFSSKYIPFPTPSWSSRSLTARFGRLCRVIVGGILAGHLRRIIGCLDHLRSSRKRGSRHRRRYPLSLELLLLHLRAVGFGDARFADGVAAPGAGTTAATSAATGGFTAGGAATAASTATFADGAIGPAHMLV